MILYETQINNFRRYKSVKDHPRDDSLHYTRRDKGYCIRINVELGRLGGHTSNLIRVQFEKLVSCTDYIYSTTKAYEVIYNIVDIITWDRSRASWRWDRKTCKELYAEIVDIVDNNPLDKAIVIIGEMITFNDQKAKIEDML